MCTPASPPSSPGSTPRSFPTEVLPPVTSLSLRSQAKVEFETRIKNNQYDTNYYAGKVKEIESPETIQEIFNNKEADKYKIVIDLDSEEVFSQVKVATINPDGSTSAS